MLSESSRPWSEGMSGRDRVRAVVETLDGPTTVQEIADRAETSRNTAADELRRLEEDKWVQETTVDGKKAYDLYPVRMYLDQVISMAEEHDREALERKLIRLKEEEEELCDEWDVDGLDSLRDTMTDENLTAEELREWKSVIDSWRALKTEIDLTKQALRTYDKVEEFQSSASAAAVTSEIL